jgi:hypothetical protein
MDSGVSAKGGPASGWEVMTGMISGVEVACPASPAVASGEGWELVGVAASGVVVVVIGVEVVVV